MKKRVNSCALCKGNCMGCFHADYCDYYLGNDGNYIPQVIVNVESASMALCEGRHQIPEATDGSIFPQELDPLDIAGMEETATEKLQGLKKLNLYVTGLTVALIAALNVCRKLGISVTLYHYNRKTGSYYEQEVA